MKKRKSDRPPCHCEQSEAKGGDRGGTYVLKEYIIKKNTTL